MDNKPGGVKPLPKLIVVLGPTAAGKTALGLALAKEFNGEVVSADSRQIYRELSIGTAKPVGEWRQSLGREAYYVAGVPHYLMDFLAPKAVFSVAEYQARAFAAIDDILARGKVPLVVGGTGLYISVIVNNLALPAVPPNAKLRGQFERKPVSELQALLRRADPDTYAVIDRQNPRRLVRALEVAAISQQSFLSQQRRGAPRYWILQIGLQWGRTELDERITRRVDEQLARGLPAEGGRLQNQYGPSAPALSSIGYRPISEYLAGERTRLEARRAIITETRRYAKRQITWFKRDRRIRWVAGADALRARQLSAEFLAA